MSIIVTIGNANALDVVEDENGNQRLVDAPGERVTTYEFPDDVSPMEAVSTVIGSLHGNLMSANGQPHWIKSTDETVASLLQQHYGVRSTKPSRWGDGTTTQPKAEKPPKKAPAKKAAAQDAPDDDTPDEGTEDGD
jgi:hypothetical protein